MIQFFNRSRKNSLFVITTFLLLVFIFLIPFEIVLASSEATGGDRSGDLWDLLFRFVNFALLIIILVWALKKANIKDF